MKRSRALIRLGFGIIALALLFFVFVPKMVEVRYISEIVGLVVFATGIAFYAIEKKRSIR